MKKSILKLLLFIWWSIFGISNIVNWEFTLLVPNVNWQDDIIISWPTTVETNETELVDIINIVNKYLRFILGWLAFAIFVYAGIQLIVWWSKEAMSKANKMLLYSIVAIVVAMLSYTLVNILINLF